MGVVGGLYAIFAAPRMPIRSASGALGGGAGGLMICQLRCTRSQNAEAMFVLDAGS